MASSGGSLTGVFSGDITFDWFPEPIIVANQLRTMAGALSEMGGPLEAAKGIAAQDISERFDTKTAPDGSPWPEWSESYALIEEGGSLLEQSGALRAAATSPDAFDVNVWPDGGEVVYSADLPNFGLAHHTGLPGRENPLPARPFIGLSAAGEVGIIEMFDAWVGSIAAGFSSGLYVHQETPSRWVQIRLPSGRWGPRIGG